MFTGIVQTTGRVEAIHTTDAGARLIIDSGGWSYKPGVGDSVAVGGCCLTHAPAPNDPADRLIFDVIHETLRKTALGRLVVGSRVNLESCVTPSSHLGGHFVLGHIDATGTVAEIETRGGEHLLTIATDAEMFRYIVPTGSVAIDGVSLTVAAIDAGNFRFTVALIPTTLNLTTLGDLKVGDPVNLEGDVLVKAVVHNMPKSR
jgi:riboflavin synthase